MGKKSKKSSGKGKTKDKDKGAVRRENELPLYRKEQPEVFKTLVDRSIQCSDSMPVKHGYVLMTTLLPLQPSMKRVSWWRRG
mmetsp:Transcript_19920/g.30353  ORF Transcript_19920/g.30353 Transcript_19920/m.30353 type:complete len:82 (+) Transcript_19920:111-356(+)